ncbi:MAG: hypothetical protein IBX64_09505 [Actinobacteria bacterium]|nr:hypothetical protein [Actinomycetota bacterium]
MGTSRSCAITVLVVLVFDVGLFSEPVKEPHYLLAPLLSLASGIIGALYFYTLYPLYARGRRLAVYFSILFIAPALILPVIIDRGDIGEMYEFLILYFPGFLIALLLAEALPSTLPYALLELFLLINITWVVRGLVGLGIGYLLEKLFKLISKAVSRWT